MTPLQHILRTARIAELEAQANELAALVRPAPVVRLSRPSSSRRGNDRRRLLLLLALERRRSARLAEELTR
jgi:hypothetical protein